MATTSASDSTCNSSNSENEIKNDTLEEFTRMGRTGRSINFFLVNLIFCVFNFTTKFLGNAVADVISDPNMHISTASLESMMRNISGLGDSNNIDCK